MAWWRVQVLVSVIHCRYLMLECGATVARRWASAHAVALRTSLRRQSYDVLEHDLLGAFLFNLCLAPGIEACWYSIDSRTLHVIRTD